MTARLKDIVRRLDTLLEIKNTPDFAGAWNGLQIDSEHGEVQRIVASVDASPRVLCGAGAEPATLLLVHHGLYWSDPRPLLGARRRKFQQIFKAGLAVYSAHLPLDLHPTLGNNALLLKALGLEQEDEFFVEFDRGIGLIARPSLPLTEIVARAEAAVGLPVRLLPFGPQTVSRLGVVTGGAGSGLARAAEAGIDTFLTGEGPHHTHALAQELGLNVIYAGHYATETFGVRALAETVAAEFALPHLFLDDPSGL